MSVRMCFLFFSFICLQHACARKRISPDDRIYYPGPTKEVPLNRYGGFGSGNHLDLPEDTCAEQTYCLKKPHDYPQAKFNEYFKGYGGEGSTRHTARFSRLPRSSGTASCGERLPRAPPDADAADEQRDDHVAKPVAQPTLVLDDISNKQGDPDEHTGCDAHVSYDPVYRVKAQGDENWRTVIQAPEVNYIQRIRLETCKHPGGKCFKLFPSIVGYITSCKQEYNVWELLVDGKNGPEKVPAELPVCCVCTYRKL